MCGPRSPNLTRLPPHALVRDLPLGKSTSEPSAPQGCPSLADSPTASPREATNLTFNLPSNLAVLQFINHNICYGNFLIVSCG